MIQTITQAWKDDRIGRSVHYVKGDLWGYLESIEVHADGSEPWNVICIDERQILTDESSQFWLMAGVNVKGIRVISSPGREGYNRS